ncbi:MAG: flagellar brake protein [Formivibrio sp.]|nr:flagellar brake protein [Formivibrio sp.]
MPDHLTLAPIQLDDPTPFLIQDMEQVQHLLTRLTRHPELVCLYPAERHEPFALSALLHLAEDHLIFDASQDERTQQLLLDATHIICVSSLDRVHIQFYVTRPQAITYEGQRAIHANRPEALLYVQRRDYFRLSVPANQWMYCQIPAHENAEFIAAEIADISLGGIGLLGPLPALILTPGMRLTGCRIELADVGTLLVDLLVCTLHTLTTRSDQHTLRIGCRFILLTGSDQTLIQRYLNRLERSRIVRK